jgi:hypothetical protein
MDGNNATVSNEEPEHARIQFANVAHFKKASAQRFAERFAMVLPILKLCQTPKNCGMVVWIRVP